MSKFIKLKTRESDTPICSGYYISIKSEDGSEHKAKLTGEEIISTFCPQCGKEHSMIFDDFIETMKDGDIYSTQVYCFKCTQKRQSERQL